MDIASAQQIGSASPDIRTGIYRGRSVTYEIIDGLAVWDGDIILGTPEELELCGECTKALVAVNNNEMLWPGGIIPYVIDPELINPHVPNAIQHWNENTVIRLVERTNQPNWVRFVPSNFCSAGGVGMKGGEQKIGLSEFCSMHGVLHEIGHIVGLWHEHQRNDRDRYIWVAPEDALGNYDHMSSRGLNSGPYDYGSVMHYGVTTIPFGISTGSRGRLSAGDIDGVNRLYGRIPTWTTITTNPAGLAIKVDGESYTAPHSFDWELGSIHTIGRSRATEWAWAFLLFPPERRCSSISIRQVERRRRAKPLRDGIALDHSFHSEFHWAGEVWVQRGPSAGRDRQV